VLQTQLGQSTTTGSELLARVRRHQRFGVEGLSKRSLKVRQTSRGRLQEEKERTEEGVLSRSIKDAHSSLSPRPLPRSAKSGSSCRLLSLCRLRYSASLDPAPDGAADGRPDPVLVDAVSGERVGRAAPADVDVNASEKGEKDDDGPACVDEEGDGLTAAADDENRSEKLKSVVLRGRRVGV
jgi:hypothetical protein